MEIQTIFLLTHSTIWTRGKKNFFLLKEKKREKDSVKLPKRANLPTRLSRGLLLFVKWHDIYIYFTHKMLNALSAVSCGLFMSKKIQEVLVLKTLKYTKKPHSPKALNKTTLSASEMINNLPCWICFDWRQMDFVECVLLWVFFSRQLQSALFEAEDQNTTSDLITSDTSHPPLYSSQSHWHLHSVPHTVPIHLSTTRLIK